MGEVRSEGLVYRVLPDGVSVALVGWYGTAPEGDVLVPASVTSGEDSYDVTCIGEDGQSICVFADSKVTTLTLPSSVQEIIEGALSGCPTLARIEVSSKNESFASFDGMLFSKDLSSLLTVPEGKEGAAHIPDQTSSVPASAFSQAPGLQSVEVGEGSVAFASRNGVLYSKELTTLMVCPPGAGQAAVISAEVERIGEQAFAGCSLASITALGFVSEIAPDAFTDEVKANALVALPAGEDYEARKAIWETAGFTHFAEPAKPGDTSVPETPENDQQASGLAYTLLDDYTLSVSWQGNDDPASDLEIPATVEVGGIFYQVSTIAPGAFTNRGSLTSVKLPSTITTLGDAAFAGCANLQTITLPEGLRTIGDRAFEATGLTDVWLPASITSLGARAFAACSSLSRIVAQSTPQVASDALAECAGVNVYCPAGSEDSWNVGLPAAGNHVLAYGITLPEEPLALVVDQSASLFADNSLKAPEPIEVAYAYAAKPVSIDADGAATGKAPGTSEVVVTLTLDNKELARATRTVEVAASPVAAEQPAAPTTEDSAVQDELDSLAATPTVFSQTFNLLGTGSALPAGSTFYSSDKTLKFTVLDSSAQTVSVKKGTVLPVGELVLPGTVENDGVVYTVTEIARATATGNAAFRDCPDLVSIVLPDTITTIGQFGLMGCHFTTFTVGSGVTTIEAQAFLSCFEMTKIIIPDSVSNIDPTAFWQCDALQTFEVSAGNQAYASVNGDLYNKSLTTLVCYAYGKPDPVVRIPDTVTDVGCDAFNFSLALEAIEVGSGNTGLSSEGGVLYNKDKTRLHCYPKAKPDAAFTVPDSVKVIGMDAFRRAQYLAQVSMSSVVTIEAMAFRSMPELAEVHFGSALETLENAAFAVCPKLSEVNLPDSVVTIESEVFNACTGVTSVVLGKSVTTIGNQAFRALPLNKLVLGPNIESVDTRAFFLVGTPDIYASGGLGVAASQVFDATTLSGSKVSLSNKNLTFDELASLKTTWVGYGFAEANVTVLGGVFGGCSWIIDAQGCLSIWPTDAAGGTLGEMGSVNAVPWYSLRSVITSVSIAPNVRGGASLACMFKDCSNLVGVEGAENLDVSGTTTMESMFHGCSKLETVNVSNWNTQEVSSMANMFNGCSQLKALDVSRWNTSKLRALNGIFNTCAALTTLDVSGWVTSSVAQMKFVFSGCSQLQAVDLSGWNVSNVTSMEYMNYNSPELTSVGDISHWNTQKVTTMKAMFDGCKKLRSLNLSGWSVDNVTSMDTMFRNCAALTSVGDLGTWNTAKVGSMTRMFTGCLKLESLNVSTWNTESVANMLSMFQNCSSLVALDVSKWSTAGVPNMSNLFRGCTNLQSLDLSGWNTAKVTNMEYMFRECSNLTSVGDLSAWNTALVTKMNGMFISCPKLASLSLSSWNVENVTTMASMIEGCASLESLDLSGWVTTSITNMAYMLKSNKNLANIVLPDNFIADGVNATELFYDCPNLTTLPSNLSFPENCTLTSVFGFKERPAKSVSTTYLGSDPGVLSYNWTGDYRALNAEGYAYSGTLPTVDGGENASWSLSVDGTLAIFCEPGAVIKRIGWAHNTHGQGHWGPVRSLVRHIMMDSGVKAQDMECWFAGMPNLLDADGVFVPEGVTSLYCLFYESGLTAAPTAWSIPNSVSSIQLIFANCTSLVSADLSNWSVVGVGNMGGLFQGCTALKTADLSGWDTSSAWKMSSMFFNCANLQSVDLTAWKTGKVTDIGSMFQGCASLSYLDTSSFDLSSATKLHFMFDGCSSLKKLDASGWGMSNAIDTYNMFAECTSLSSLDVSGWNLSKVENMNRMFKNCSSLHALDASNWRMAAVKSLDALFSGCTSLASLPEGFAIPSTVTSLTDAFRDCPSLTSIPSTLSFSSLSVAAKNSLTNAFKVTSSAPLVTYYAGDPANIAQGSDYWTTQNRVLVTAVPDGRNLISFMVPNGEGVYDEVFATILSDAEDKLSFFDGPVKPGRVFIGWYIDEAGTTPFDFAKTVAEQALTNNTLYARYVESSGTLPTTDGQNNAIWELTGEGTLVIACNSGATISDLGWSTSNRASGYWGPVRSLVTRIVMDPSVKAESMAHWFCDMVSLEDISQAHIPYGVTNLSSLFNGCSSLKEIPEGFVIPDTVTIAGNCFISCTSLASIAEGFTLPDSITSVSGMFAYCSSLASLPDSFRIPKSATSASYMFFWSGIKHLPNGFSLPEKLTTINSMFANSQLEALPATFLLPNIPVSCDSTFHNTKLTSLPAGFTIPFNVTNTGGMLRGTLLSALPEGFAIENPTTKVTEMFLNCTSLVSLPKSLNLSALTGEGKLRMFALSGYDDNPLTTYYAGDAADVEGADYWLKNFSRTLVTAADPLPQNTFKVTFKLQKPGEAQASEWMTVLTDATGHVSAPAEPTLFGYAFSGWKVKDASGTSQDFDFSQAVTADTVLEGSYTLITKVDVPLQAKVEVDASGNVTPASAEFVSRTPVALKVAQVVAEEASGSAQLFPNTAERAGVTTLVGLGSSSFRVSLGAGPQALSGGNLDAASAAETTKLPVTLSLDLNGAQLNYQPNEGVAPFAKLTWTVEVA